MSAQVKADGFTVRNTDPRRPRLRLRLGKVWHGDIIRLLCRQQKITEAAAQNRSAVLNAGKFTKNLKFVFENCFRNEGGWYFNPDKKREGRL